MKKLVVIILIAVMIFSVVAFVPGVMTPVQGEQQAQEQAN
ncbi:MAG: hypothetical protein UT33_C0008G0008 [Candidatus Peregrinibacteria bacterium GW2011_GWC2_39_14]|nr:MAG: hypothetical protein US92_C0004G0008 [Candidatus Peregrinibacteria bacterium GW2011_GWA2_38_36]KKR06692.1 MAG: hypothetical protein UT33_C0008G0008 [Candidatus Peregrinibacteria bacterium GW2011_GWC2_39_14]